MAEKWKPTSVFFRVRVPSTAEEQDFTTESEAQQWMEKWVLTFQSDGNFELIKIREHTLAVRYPLHD